MNIEPHRIGCDNKIIGGCSHTSLVLNHKSRNKIIIKAVCNLRKIKDDFDAIACCGTSGLLVVPQIAELLDKNIIVVRKKDDNCYSKFRIEGANTLRYIIVDDLICSGKTVKTIIKEINIETPRAKCIGVYCYIPDECAYKADKDGSKLCERDLRVPLLNL
jgi:adenine/guanine phosphoribosyltransferase-like PRPP-binding protein